MPRLRVVTTFSTGINRGHEGQPLVFNNTMYVVTPFPNNLIAVDLTKPGGATKWVYEPHPDNRAVGIACCDVVNRDAVYAGATSSTACSMRTSYVVVHSGIGGWMGAVRLASSAR